MKKVLVTGISGYIGQHCAVELLKEGYYVKGSLRDLERIDEVVKCIKKEFGNDYIFEVIRTHYPNWENKKKISAIFSIKKNKT